MRGAAIVFSKKKIVSAHSVEKCTECGELRKRNFVPGDVLFTQSKCISCGGKAMIEKIFGETMP